MTQILRPNTCATCVYKDRDGKILRCRRNPPVVHPIFVGTPQGPQLAGEFTGWPVVQPENWCGEFSAFSANRMPANGDAKPERFTPVKMGLGI